MKRRCSPAPSAAVAEEEPASDDKAARRRSTVREKVSFLSSSPSEPATPVAAAPEPVAPPARLSLRRKRQPRLRPPASRRLVVSPFRRRRIGEQISETARPSRAVLIWQGQNPMQSAIVLGGGMVGVERRAAPPAARLVGHARRPQGAGPRDQLRQCRDDPGEAVRPYPMPRDLASLLKIATGRTNDVRYSLSSLHRHVEPLLRYWWHSAPKRHREAIDGLGAADRLCDARSTTSSFAKPMPTI